MSNRKRRLSAIHSEASDGPPVKRQKIALQVMEQFESLLQQNKHNDVQFIVGESDNQQTFNANKLVFTAQSEVFEAMLFGGLARATNEAIQIPDVQPLAFSYLHKLFCMKETQLTYDIVVDVLYAAQKYLIHIVIDECIQKLHSVANIDDLFVILASFQEYAPSVFAETIPNLLRNAKFIEDHLIALVTDVRFIELTPFIVQKVIATDLFPSETSKYEAVKNYCIKSETEEEWQSLFKNNFLKCMKLKKLSTEYLLSTIKNDDILSSDTLLEIINNKSLKNVGFKLYDVLLTLPERKNLKIGDFVDKRDGRGSWFEAKVIGITERLIKLRYVGYDDSFDRHINVKDWQWIARHKSVSGRNYVSRPCMKQLKGGDYVYVNYAYHPEHGEKHESVWRKCQIQQRKEKQIFTKYVGAQTKQIKYFVHLDSQNECRCLNDKCEYCVSRI